MPHYRFAETQPERVIAHAGRLPIHSARVQNPRIGSAVNFVDLVTVPSGADVGLHRHSMRDEEFYVIIQGTGRMLIDGVEASVGPGDVLLNPPGGTHSLINTGDGELKFVVIDVSIDGSAYVEPTNVQA